MVRRSGTEEKPIVRLDGIGRREDVEALRGADLLCPRERGARRSADDEWFAEDLEGCRVVDGEREVGRRAPARRAALVRGARGRAPGRGDLLVPMVRDAIRSVDVAARLIDVDVGFLGEQGG